MIKKKILILPLLGFAILLSICPPSVGAYEYSDNINEGISVFFLTALDVGENIEVNITHTGDGNFILFLFNERPDESYVNFDNTLNAEIFEKALDHNSDENPSLYYIANESKIYYIELILLENGPDTYILYCNRELTRYYLPIISGYYIILISTSIVLISGVLIIYYAKKLQKK